MSLSAATLHSWRTGRSADRLRRQARCRHHGGAAAAPHRHRRRKGRQRLQLVRLHRAHRHRGLREGDRHQGQLRSDGFQRAAGDQAAGRAAPATTWWCRRPRSSRARSRRASTRSSTSRSSPNYKNLDADITKRLEVFDPGNEYAVNYMWGTSGVGYNEAKIKEAMPNAPVDSFAMFWDPTVFRRIRQVRHLGARRAQRGRRHRADLPRQGCQQREPRRPEGRRRRC